MELRAEPRIPMRCAVVFSGYQLELEGTVKNLSLNGWSLETPTPVQPGTPLFLSVSLPDEEEPLEIELATVRWSRDGELGLRTVIMGSDSRARLEHFLAHHHLRHESLHPAPAEWR